jgi:hypothetical protein
MAVTKTLPTDVLNSIAKQVGERMQPIDGNRQFRSLDGQPLADQGWSVAESFEVWKFIPDALEEIADGTNDITRLVRRAGVWHHQLRQEDKAIGFARSKPLGPDPASWSVRDIFVSDLAQAFDRAIVHVDHQHVPDNVEVRLISMPRQQVEAFWFVSEASPPDPNWNNQVLIVRTPKQIHEFAFLKQMKSEEFLAALVTKEPGMGIRPKP